VYSLEDLYLQAIKDRRSTYRRDTISESIISYGMKLNKYKDLIQILNTTKSAGYYTEATPDELEYLFTHGWRKGVLMIALANYTRKMDIIEFKIQSEMNTRKNDKYIRGLKKSRDKIMLKYSKRKSELKLIKDEK
jgi:hypothetical protein